MGRKKTNENKSAKVADLLPNKLSKDAIKEIVTLVNETIETKVNEQTQVLVSKVNAFLKQNMQKIREAALVDLTESDEVIKGYAMFNKIKGVLLPELVKEDSESQISLLETERANLHTNNEDLKLRYNQLIRENELLGNKVEKMTSQNEQLLESLTEAENATKDPFKSSEVGIIHENVTQFENLKSGDTISLEQLSENEFLTKEIIDLSRNLNS